MKPGSNILVLVLLLVVSVSGIFAQSFRIPMVVNGGPGWMTDTLWFGVDTAATNCDDPELGENHLPPPPAGMVFDARFVSPRSQNAAVCYDQGMLIDLRPFSSTTQIDTYKVKIQRQEGNQTRISWPNLSPYYTNNVWLRRYPPMTINMKTDTTYLLTEDDGDPALFTIITGDPAFVPQPPSVGSVSAGIISLTSARLTAGVVPHGYSTTAWFQWGTTTGYGDSTAPQVFGTGVGYQVSAVISGLSRGTTYHCRLVGQNANGIVYGNDASFTTLPIDTPSTTLIPIHITDNLASLMTVVIGVHPSATFCVDPGLGIGEEFLPPTPPTITFDARLVYPRPGYSDCFDQGTRVDLRPYIGPSQVDTFKIRLQSSYANSFTFMWPNITSYFNDPVRLIDRFGGLLVNVDMKSETTFTLSDPYWLDTPLLVIAGTPPSNRGPAVLTNPPGNVVYTSAQFDGIANPNGFASTGWFEWGLDANYGNTTPIQSLGSGASIIPVTEAVSGLYPGTMYHYRVVAQNGNGTMEGPDRTFTTDGITNQYSMTTGWNMLSLPITVGDARKTVLFPTAGSNAFTYVHGQGFVMKDTLSNGAGYWLKYGSAQNVSVAGAPVAQDTFDIKTGWNMIGSITNSADISSIVQIPAGIVQSSFFGFNGSYVPATTLDPGKAYWVKSSANGRLVISPSSAKPSSVTNTKSQSSKK